MILSKSSKERGFAHAHVVATKMIDLVSPTRHAPTPTIWLNGGGITRHGVVALPSPGLATRTSTPTGHARGEARTSIKKTRSTAHPLRR